MVAFQSQVGSLLGFTLFYEFLLIFATWEQVTTNGKRKPVLGGETLQVRLLSVFVNALFLLHVGAVIRLKVLFLAGLFISEI